jgi:hypothetical protein
MSPWPEYDPELARADVITLVVQERQGARSYQASAGITEDQALS